MKAIFAPSINWLDSHNKFVPGSGPNPLRLFDLLLEQGIESKVIDMYPYPLNPFAGKDTLLQSIDVLRALRIAIAERDADVIVSVFEGAAFSLGAMRWLLPSKTAIVLWEIGLTNWQLRDKVINFTLPRIDELVVVGNNQLPHIQKRYEKCKNITAIGHFVDSDFYSQVSLNETGFILSVGDDIGRDFSTLMEATREIGRELVIKASRHPPMTTNENVRVISDRISYLALRSLYVDCAVVVVPTHKTQNACGVTSILEASAMGRPVVVTDNPGIRDFIVPNETCLVVPPNDALALRNSINLLLGDPDLCKRLADGARSFIETNFTCERFADRLGGVLQRVVSERK